MSERRRIGRLKILLAKVGFDGHDRGVKILAATFRDEGHEVIYLGKYLTVDAVVAAAVQEDVDVIGLSFLGGSHIGYCEEAGRKMRENGLADALLVVGGTIPHQDFDSLKNAGVDAVFSANTRLKEITDFLDGHCAARGSGQWRK